MSKMSTEHAADTRPACPVTRQTLNGATMGTRYSAIFYASPDMALPPLASALSGAVDRVDRQMSGWKPGSDLNRLNVAEIGIWIGVPRELVAVLAQSLRIGQASSGAFDIGVGDLVAAWGFGLPGNDASGGGPILAAAERRPVTSAALELDVNTGRARRLAPIKLDLSGIAKGYGVDELARVMGEFDIRSWLVGIDGEMRAKGLKPDGTMWTVAHERPDREVREAMGVLELRDMAVATSGNYRHFREAGGRIVSHTMNPRTAQPLDNDVASVTVLAPTCMIADAWATAFMVMGADRGLKAARAHGLDAIFVLQDGRVRATL